MMTDDEIAAEVCTYPCQMVILTGGEPGLSIDSQLTKALHAAEIYHNETNGTCVWLKISIGLLVHRRNNTKITSHRRSESGICRPRCIPLP